MQPASQYPLILVLGLTNHGLCFELKQIAINHGISNCCLMLKRLALTLLLIAPSLAGAESFLCEATKAAGFRLGSDNKLHGVTYETKHTNFVLKKDGDAYSFTKPSKMFPNHEISAENCGVATTPSEGFFLGAKAVVCSDWLYTFHMDVDNLGFAASQVSVDWGLGTWSWIGTCTKF